MLFEKRLQYFILKAVSKRDIDHVQDEWLNTIKTFRGSRVGILSRGECESLSW